MIVLSELENMRQGKLLFVREVEPIIRHYPQHAGKKNCKERMCLTKCDCGNEFKLAISKFKGGYAHSCGCTRGKGRGSGQEFGVVGRDYIALEPPKTPSKFYSDYTLNIYNLRVLVEYWDVVMQWYNSPEMEITFPKIYRIKYLQSDILVLPLNTIVSRRIVPNILEKESRIREMVETIHPIMTEVEYIEYMEGLSNRNKKNTKKFYKQRSYVIT
jgi:hypothetical protein